MFEAVELGIRVDNEAYDKELLELRAALLDAQFDLHGGKRCPVLIVIGGIDGAGRGEVVNHLKEWFDVRGLQTHALGRLGQEVSRHPESWAWWNALPAKGEIGIYFGSWYTDPLRDRFMGRAKEGRFHRYLDRIAAYERTHADDGALIIKIWLHLGHDDQKKRLQKLEKSKETRGRFSDAYWKRYEAYSKVVATAETMIRRTDTALAPWTLVDAADRNHRNLVVAKSVLRALRGRLDAPPASLPTVTPPAPIAPEATTILDRVELSAAMESKKYARRFKKYQDRLGSLAWDAYEAKRSLVVLFEGWDAAGKGGAIRRMTWAIDARLVRVIAISAPTEEEKAHNYLWRFWRHVPTNGRILIFDRSWYGRVLVERVEGFAKPPEWQRAYREINEFEDTLVKSGVVLLKYFLHIDRDEQLRRFEAREQTSHKRYKITPEDWRNREKWDEYEGAINEMVARTSTTSAPWHLIPANDKKHARAEILRNTIKALEDAL